MMKSKDSHHIASAHDHSFPNNSIGINPLYEGGSIINADVTGPLLNAKHTVSEEKVAIKLLSPPRMVDETSLHAVTHAHIVEVLDVLPSKNGGTLVVLQPPRGTCAHRVLSIQQKLKPHHAVNITMQLLEILKYLHDKKILHKSINSKSVFLLRKSTHRIDVNLMYLGLNGGGAALNDPEYLSPEQVVDVGHSDRKDDLWAAGVLLYEMVYGILPFMGKTADETLGRILLEEVSLPPNLLEEHPNLQVFIRRALTKQSDERYHDAASMMADLHACFNQSHSPEPTGSSFPPADTDNSEGQGPMKNDTPTLPAPKVRKRHRRDDSDLTNPSIKTCLLAREELQQAKADLRERELQQYVQSIERVTDERHKAKRTTRLKPRGNK